MDRSLAAFAAEGAPFETRLHVALGLARALAALHRRRRVHGALGPEAVIVAGEHGEVVALAPPRQPRSPLELAGWAAPEVVRGRAPTRRSDAFSAGALARLALTGRGPFDGAPPVELARRVLFDEARPARLDDPAIPEEAAAAIARLLERRPRRRGRVSTLVAALERSTSTFDSKSSTPTPTPTATRVSAVLSTALGASLARFAPLLTKLRPTLSSLTRRIPPSPLHRAGLAAIPLLLLALAFLRGPDAALAREVAALLERGDPGAARTLLDAAPLGAERAVVEKLRGDVACARRAPGECLRRYRTALAARPSLRDDPALRRNVRALLAAGEGCATRRSAALLAGELRDPEALPALERARRSGGLFSFLCTGDAIDRAIAATRGAAR